MPVLPSNLTPTRPTSMSVASPLIPISEIFGPTIQGEGALVGRPTFFVRTGGCDFRCSWCDSLFAVLPQHRDEWTKMGAQSILEEVERLSLGFPTLITLSGGNPALQPLGQLLELGHERGHSFALETQGTASPEWLRQLDYLVLSPKPPSSGMAFDATKLVRCIEVAGDGPHISLKVVVFDEADYQFARDLAAQYPWIPFFLSVGNPAPMQERAADMAELTNQVEWLIARTARDGWREVTISPQVHVLLWGNKRGV